MAGRKRFAAVLVLLAAAVVCAFFLPLERMLDGYLAWAEDMGPLGAVIVCATYVPGCVLCVPGTPITYTAAFAFGFTATLPPIILFTNLGAQAAFLVSRYLLRERVVRRIAKSPRLLAFDRAVANSGFRTVLLLRFSPLVPFNLLNYFLGACPVRYRDYALATFLGMLPGNVLTVYIGTALGSLAQALRGEAEVGTAGRIMFGLGLVATIAVVVLLSRGARKALAEIEARG